MRKVNLGLSVVALALLVASVALYRSGLAQGERFERGQRFLPNLNPDQVATISLERGEESVTLRRSGERFEVEEAEGYAAKNEAVNRLLRDVVELSLEKEVGRSAELEESLALEPPTERSLEVTLESAEGVEMVRFRVGETGEEGRGVYVQRRDGEPGPIYLTDSRPSLGTDPSTYLDNQILDVDASEVARVEGPDFVAERGEEGGALALAAVPAGRQPRTTAMNRLRGVLSRLNFQEVYVADDPEVADLEFARRMRVELTDGSGYRLLTAEKDDRTFLRVEGFHTVERVEIARDESEEELEEKAEVLERADEIQRFNQEHGTWVYELNDHVAGKVMLTKEELVEEAG